MTQCEQIREYLEAGNTLTPLESLERFGTLSLSQRCGELRRQGCPIVSTLIRTPTGKHVAEYRWRVPFE